MMRCFYIFLIMFLFIDSAFANVLNKVQLEEAIQRRLEANLAVYDKDLRVKAQFMYRMPSGLPGTTFLEGEDFATNTISESDIRGISIEVHTRLPQMTSAMQDDIYSMIPVRRSRIKLKYIQLLDKPTQAPPPLVAKDFWDISNNFKTDAAQLLLGLVFGSVFIMSVLFVLMHRSQIRQSRENFGLLVKSIQESAPPMSGGLSLSGAGAGIQRGPHPEELSTPAAGQIALPLDSLKELFADCYWCEEDGYAHWLWQRTSLEQKKQLMEAWPPLKKYSAFFVSVPMDRKAFHEHPYYLSPEPMSSVSQAVLEKEVKKNSDIWLGLSPLRQLRLQIPIADKLRIVKKEGVTVMPTFQVPSVERVFPRHATLGDLSFEDEVMISQKPTIVPTNMRTQFRSLVWLSLQQSSYIEGILAQHDALSLASAWVAAPSILEILEKHIPEKKLKLLHAYREKVVPSKQSEAYQLLVKAGLQNEAA